MRLVWVSRQKGLGSDAAKAFLNNTAVEKIRKFAH